MTDLMARAQREFDGFSARFSSAVLATVDEQGVPTASYIPCVEDEQGRFYGFVSRLAAHTANLEQRKRASVLFIEDESGSAEIFARRRLTYDCTAEVLEREHTDTAGIMQRFVARFSGMGERIVSLPDFRAVRLTPRGGNFVIGFGAAFRVEGRQLQHLGGGGQGRGHGHGADGGHGAHGQEGHGHGGSGRGTRSPEGSGHGPGAAVATEATPSGAFPADAVARILEHMNSAHADALQRAARTFGQLKDACSARMEGLDASGIELSVVRAGGVAVRTRIPFPEPLGGVEEAHLALRVMAQEARRRLEAAAS